MKYTFNVIGMDRCEIDLVGTFRDNWHDFQQSRTLQPPIITAKSLLKAGFDKTDLNQLEQAIGGIPKLIIESGNGKGNRRSFFRIHCPGLFMMPLYAHGKFAARAELYSTWFALQRYPLANFQVLLKAAFGFDWQGEQLSRLDLCVDVPQSFSSFAAPIDQHCYVCRGDFDQSASDKYESTRYFGSHDRTCLRIYDKVLDLRKSKTGIHATIAHRNLNSLGGSDCTRIEYELNRRTLSRKGINSFSDLRDKLPSLWPWLTTNWLRLTDKPNTADVRSDDLPVWPVWQLVQGATLAPNTLLDLGSICLPSDVALLN